MSPDDLLLSLFRENAEDMTSVISSMTQVLHNPDRTVNDTLTALALAGAKRFAAEVRHAIRRGYQK